MSELPVIQKTYDFIKWYVPILNRLPRDHKYAIGGRITSGLYELLEGFVTARYARQKVEILEPLNTQIDLLRLQTRLLQDFGLLSPQKYEYVAQNLHSIGTELGGWIKQQKKLSRSQYN
jgi:hypothetical protein